MSSESPLTDPQGPEAPRPAPSSSGRTSRGIFWLTAGGLIIIVAAGVATHWLDQKPNEGSLPPLLPVDPAWAKREQDIIHQVEAIRESPPQLDEKAPHPVTSVSSNARPDLSAFRIAEDHRTYDLRAWKPVGSGDAPHSAGVLMVRRMRLTKVSAADRLDFLGRTSGADLVMRCESPHPDRARLFVSQTKPQVEGQAMTEHRLSVDVSDVAVGSEFALNSRTTFWNSLQTPEEQWFGMIGSDGSKLLSILILFPESRPFQGGGLRHGPVDGTLKPYDGTQMVFKGPDGAWVYWEVPGPKTDYTYRLDWKW